MDDDRWAREELFIDELNDLQDKYGLMIAEADEFYMSFATPEEFQKLRNKKERQWLVENIHLLL